MKPFCLKYSFPILPLFCTFSVSLDSWIFILFFMSCSIPVIIYFNGQIIQDLAIWKPLQAGFFRKSVPLTFPLGFAIGFICRGGYSLQSTIIYNIFKYHLLFSKWSFLVLFKWRDGFVVVFIHSFLASLVANGNSGQCLA